MGLRGETPHGEGFRLNEGNCIYPLRVEVLLHSEAVHHTRGRETALHAAQHQRQHSKLSAAHPERKECMVVTCVVLRVNG